ncbi:MAG: response regulator, partial [Bacteroidales bacterium]|nr:response regulator [Bacteroidales bacterium]
MKFPHQISGKKIRVLIVDDSLIGRKLLSGILASDPIFEVVAVAENGKLAYEKVLHFRPDVVSMDINMPI